MTIDFCITIRCQELLHQKDGPRWREKFQLPSVSPWQIPEIIDPDGKPTSQVVVNNPVPTQQQCPIAQSNVANQKTDKLGEDKKEAVKEPSAAEKFEKFKAEGNEFVKKVNRVSLVIRQSFFLPKRSRLVV